MIKKDWHNFSQIEQINEPEPKHVLIIGDSSFRGRHIAKAFLDAGWQVTIFSKASSGPLQNARLKYISGDRLDKSFLEASFIRQTYDCTIDLECVTKKEAETIGGILFGRTGHHIHLSSVDIYRISKTLPLPWREHDLDSLDVSLSVIDKPQAEKISGIFESENVIREMIRQKGFPATIVRTSHTCDPFEPGKSDLIHVLRVLDGEPVIVPEPSCLFRHIYVGDLAAAFMRIASSRKTPGQIYNLAGATIIDLTEYFTLLATILEKKVNIASVPLKVCRKYFSENEYPYFYDTHIIPDITALTIETGFQPRGIDRFLSQVVETCLNEYDINKKPEGYFALREKEREILRSMS